MGPSQTKRLDPLLLTRLLAPRGLRFTVCGLRLRGGVKAQREFSSRQRPNCSGWSTDRRVRRSIAAPRDRQI